MCWDKNDYKEAQIVYSDTKLNVPAGHLQMVSK